MDAAIRLFSKEGISAATSAIAEEAGVSNGTLFNYFDTKQDLIDGAYIYIKERMANEIISEIDMESGIREILYSTWTLYINWASENPIEHQVMEMLKASQLLSEDVIKAGEHFWVIIYDAFEQGAKKGELVDAPNLLLFELAAGHVNSSIRYAKNNHISGKELENIIDKSFEIYWQGISTK